jgi:chitin synthase
MYKEDPFEVKATLDGIHSNIKSMCSGRWGDEVWKNACVCIVADGLPQFLSTREGNGKARRHDGETERAVTFADTYSQVFEESLLDSEAELHLFAGRYSASNVKPSGGGGELTPSNVKPSGGGDELTPLQLMLGIKAKNKASKLDSHQWFFEFAEYFRTDKGVDDMMVFLIDAGTEPQQSSLAMLVHAMETDRTLGGVCGEISIGSRAPIAEGGSEYYCKAIVAAQAFEYKASHLLDKSFESVFGYISVLPDAFSGYRFEAIHPRERAVTSKGRGTPLERYFHSLQEDHTPNISTGNMYLAEDRIICFEMLAAPRHGWQMRYVKGACAIVDPVDDQAVDGALGGCCSWQFAEETALEGLIKQRVQRHCRSQLHTQCCTFN